MNGTPGRRAAHPRTARVWSREAAQFRADMNQCLSRFWPGSLSAMSAGEPLIRIGELSRRLGVSVDRLRAWERRYELLQPVRTSGGFRLYTRADELRVRTMHHHLGEGLSAAEAARAALAADAAAPVDRAPGAARLRPDLAAALTG